MRPPQTIGLECARPGSAVFHATFLDVATSHWTGGLAVAATPLASVPRNAGQFCADAAQGASSDTTRGRTMVCFITDVVVRRSLLEDAGAPMRLYERRATSDERRQV